MMAAAGSTPHLCGAMLVVAFCVEGTLITQGVRWAALVIAAMALLARPAQAKPEKWGLGIFVPELGATPAEVFDAVDQIARLLSERLGAQVVGRGYKRAGDLVSDIRANKIHFALVGAFQVSAMPGAAKVLAVGASGPVAGRSWTLMGTKAVHLVAIEGEVLQLPNVGPRVEDLVEYGLLEGNLPVRKFFKVNRSPGLYSALEAVRLGAAATVLAPLSSKGLVPLVPRRIVVPPPALLVVAQGVPDDVVRSVRETMLGYKPAGGILPRFVAGDLRAYQVLAAQRRRRRMPMVPAPVDSPMVDQRHLLASYRFDSESFELPELDVGRLFQTTRAH